MQYELINEGEEKHQGQQTFWKWMDEAKSEEKNSERCEKNQGIPSQKQWQGSFLETGWFTGSEAAVGAGEHLEWLCSHSAHTQSHQ